MDLGEGRGTVRRPMGRCCTPGPAAMGSSGRDSVPGASGAGMGALGSAAETGATARAANAGAGEALGQGLSARAAL